MLMLTILRSLVQSRLDYCSQLWSPRDQHSINLLESVQRNFVSKICDRALTGMSYWEKLSELRVYSQERRRERYQICFLWKLSQGLIEGYSVNWQLSERRGRYVIPNPIPKNAPSTVRKARECSLGVHGAHIFNILQKSLRNENSADFPLLKPPGYLPDHDTRPTHHHWTGQVCCLPFILMYIYIKTLAANQCYHKLTVYIFSYSN